MPHTPPAPVTPDMLPSFAEQLHALRAELLDRIKRQRGGEIGRAEAAANERSVAQGDWAQTDAERDLAVTLEERELAELNDIGAALKAIAEASFGSCVDCSADIGAARLRAAPTAVRCIACQTKLEHTRGPGHTPTM